MTASLHLLVDLRTTQVFRERGVPRYTQGLVLALAVRHPEIRYSWLIEPDTGTPGGAQRPLYHDKLDACGRWVTAEQIAGLPRVTHYLQGCLFDRGRTATTLFPPGLAAHQPQLSAILYDLIPWIYPEQYLRHPEARLAYERGLNIMRQMPRLFSISECSRIDAVAAGCEPARITTIYGGWDDDRFAAPPAEPPSLPAHYWLYIGGADRRKNMPALFAAWVRVRRNWPPAGGQGVPGEPPTLVTVCSLQPEDRAQLEGEARQAGLPPSAYVLTGHLPDGAMEAVICGAEALVFPALYEGLGLPVLEAYQYDRPALVSDSSSLRELAPPACRFDPTDPASIAAKVLEYYVVPAVAAASRAFAPTALELCRWPRAADQVADWLAESNAAPAAPSAEPGLSVVSTLPPDRSGIAVYTRIALADAPWRTTFFAPWGGAPLAAAQDDLYRYRHALRALNVPPRVLPAHSYRPRPGQPTLWVLGNSEHHFSTLRALLAAGRAEDWIYLHEAELGGMLTYWGCEADAAQHSPALAGWGARKEKPAAVAALLAVVAPRNVIVNSPHAADDLLVRLPPDLASTLRVEAGFLPLAEPFLPPAGPVDPATRDGATPLRVMHVGILGPNKQPERLVAACQQLHESSAWAGRIELVFAGYAVRDYLASSRLNRPWITTLEAPDGDALRAAMLAADVGVQPRWPQHGESSGAVADWLVLGKPLVTTQAAGFSGLAGAIHGVAPDVSAPDLAQAIADAACVGASSGLAAWRDAHRASAWQDWLGRVLGITPA